MEVIERFLIRHGCERDAAGIARIHVGSWQAAYRGLVPDEVLDALDPVKRTMVWRELLGMPEETVLVAMGGGRLAGFCTLQASRDAGVALATGEIASFYVDPPAWGRGAGRELAEQLVRQARARNFARLTLWVIAGNTRARRFFERCGFAADGMERDEDRQGHLIPVMRYAREM